MEARRSFTQLSNIDLTAEVIRLAGCERTTTADLIASLAEFDRRRLYLEHGYSSLFGYCVAVLHLSEHAAYGRIEAARTARKFASVLILLEEGRLTLTNLCLLSPHLTAENHASLLEEAAHKRNEDVQKLVARLAPKPDVVSVVRKLPVPAATQARPVTAARAASPLPSTTEASTPPPSFTRPAPAVVVPLAPERYKLQITIDEDTREVLRQAQDLMRHANPSGDPAVIVARALRVLVDDLLKKKASLTERPRATRAPAPALAEGSRAIPASVQRDVWQRDGGQCVFEGPRGRCPERGFLEFHHVIPYGLGGEATANNIELRCRAHNSYQANLDGLGWRWAAPV